MMKKGIVFLVFAAFLFFAAYELHPFGDLDRDGDGISSDDVPMDTYILQNAPKNQTGETTGENEAATNNVVTSVVFDYRGYDTLGEATVLFTAIAGALVVLRRKT
jgi:hypothetical protein